MKYPRELYNAGAVKRWHTVRTIQEQTVADHSWGVISILLQICEPSIQLLYVAAFHDLAEVSSGDIPAPIKWAYPKLDAALDEVEHDFNETHRLDMDLTPYEQTLLKWADMMELVMFTTTEIQMGNTYMVPIRNRGINYLKETGFPSTAAEQFFHQVVSNVPHQE